MHQDHNQGQANGGLDPSCNLGLGEVIDGKYTVLSLLGAGGAGAVYLVETQDGLPLALKILHAGAATVEKKRLRFVREALLASRLEHPGIVRIVSSGVHNGTMLYYVMEIVEGETLESRLRKRPVSLEFGLDVAICLAQALEYAHGKGVIHRDIKPANIFLAPPQSSRKPLACQAKLLDFGLARSIVSEESQSLGLTGSRDVIGTPVYISPEQSMGRTMDARSDIYSLGVTLFELFAGAPPLLGNSAMETIILHQEVPAPKMAEVNPDIELSPELEAIVARCLAKRPADRYQNAGEIYRDLLAYKESLSQDGAAVESQAEQKSGSSSSYIWIAVVASVSLFLLAVSAYFALTSMREPRQPPAKVVSSVAKPSDMVPSVSEEERLQEDWRRRSQAVQPGSYLLKGNWRDGAQVRRYGLPRQMPPASFFVHQGNMLQGVPLKPSAGGLMLVPAGAGLAVTVSSDLMAAPRFLLGFDPAVLKILHFHKSAVGVNKFLSQMTYFTGLERIDAQCTDTGDSTIEYLNKFPALRSINLGQTSVTAGGVAQLKRLPQLFSLELAGNKGDSLLRLDKLKTSNSLRLLILEAMPLSRESLSALAEIDSLGELHLRGCSLASSDLHELLPLASHLAVLEISGDKLNKGSLETLKRFKKLRFLMIESADWTEQERQQLALALPACKIMSREVRPVTPEADAEF